MIMINNEWQQVETIEEIQRIVAENLSEELAAQIESFLPEHSDNEYWDLECELNDVQNELENLEDEYEWDERRIEELEEENRRLTDREKLIQILNDFFQMEDTYTYNLTRVKSAFSVGTVSLEDFEEFSEQNIDELADVILEGMKK